MNNPIIQKIRRTANWGLYGSIAVIALAITFHYSPWRVAPQSPQVFRWMLLSGIVLVVLAIVAILLKVRKTTPAIRQSEAGVEAKLQAYAAYISSLYNTSWSIVIIESVIIVLISDTSLLMPTILMVLVLFLCYPNMYKMKNDLGLNDEEMKSLFGDDYIAGDNTAAPNLSEASPDLPLADAQLERDAAAEAEAEAEEEKHE